MILPDFETAVQGSLAAVEIRFAAARQRKRSTPSHIEDIAWTTVLNPALEPSTLASRPLDFETCSITRARRTNAPLVALRPALRPSPAHGGAVEEDTTPTPRRFRRFLQSHPSNLMAWPVSDPASLMIRLASAVDPSSLDEPSHGSDRP